MATQAFGAVPLASDSRCNQIVYLLKLCHNEPCRFIRHGFFFIGIKNEKI